MSSEARDVLPFIVTPRFEDEAGCEGLKRLVETKRDFLSEQVLRHGALLFRGFAIRGSEQFAEVVAALSGRQALLEYTGGASPRRALATSGQPIYNSTEYPPDLELALHNELSYSDTYPERVYFFCLTAPADGGETTLGDSRRILEKMPSTVRRRFEEKGVCYIRTLWSGKGSGYSWQDAFASEDRGEVERHCAAMGAEFEWLEGDALRIRQSRPATTVHPETGEAVWFNQADGFHSSALDPVTYSEMLAACGSEDRFRLNVSYGDGTPIERSELDAARQVIRQEARAHAWQDGDLLMLDNVLAAHGRRPFRGARHIAVAMS